MKLPSAVGGPTTETVGVFECNTLHLAEWLAASMGTAWTSRSARWTTTDAMLRDLAPGGPLTRHALIPWNGWTALLTDGPLGTDVGMVPSLAARQLGCTALRATAVDQHTARLGATILEVFDPSEADDPLRCRRSIAAADDGDRWVFSQFGEPYPFEDQVAYRRRRVRDRFTTAMLLEILAALGVPVDRPLHLADAHVVELA